MTTPVLSLRALNRALLERHLLLRRRRESTLVAIELLVGLQSQVPRDPYVALWSRLRDFRPQTLSDAMEDHRVVRMSLFRSTLHTVTADDALRLHPVIHPVLRRGFFQASPFGRQLEGIDVDELLATARRLLEERPRTRAELSRDLAPLWPDRDEASLAYAATYLLPLVQVTPRGLWLRSGPSAFTTLERWIGRAPGRPAAPDDLVLRYLGRFGPATPADAQSWSGLTGLREVFERLRPRLRTFRDEGGREIFDVPDAPMPDPQRDAPVRFLPEYDNVVLGHKDRARIVTAGLAQWTGVGWGIVLVDGFTAARWRLLDGDPPALRIEHRVHLTSEASDDVEHEGMRLARFLVPGERRAAVHIEVDRSTAERRR